MAWSSEGGVPIQAAGSANAAESTGPRSSGGGRAAGADPQDASKSSEALNRKRSTEPVPCTCQGAGPSSTRLNEIPMSVSPSTCTATPAEQLTANENTGSH